MSKIDQLLTTFTKVINEPWSSRLSGQEKVWFLIFDPVDLRKLQFRIGEFEIEAKKANKEWRAISLKKFFTDWLSAHDYKEAYFENPDDIIDSLEYEFVDYVINRITEQIKSNSENELLVLNDVSALFGHIKLSSILNAISKDIHGRLMILFPGEYSNNQYRLMDARAGWDYLARPIQI